MGGSRKVDLLNQLATIGRFLNASSAIPQQPFTDVTKLTGTFDVVNGVAQTNDLRAMIPAKTWQRKARSIWRRTR